MDIEVIHLSKQFDRKQIWKDLNINFPEGKINCLMGSSGVGKTTLINILMGLVGYNSGKISGIQGKRIAAVFQENCLIEHWDAEKNIRLVCDKSVANSDIEKHFQDVGLCDYQNIPVSKLSGGMRRRVAIVRAILAKSDIIIMDEPFEGLDEELKKQVIEYVKYYSTGKTAIIITHDKEDVKLLDANLITMQSDQ